MATRGRLPLKKSLVRYNARDLKEFLRRLGIRPNTIGLRRSLTNFLERYIGVSDPEPDLLEHIHTQLDRKVRRWLEDEVRNAMSVYRWDRLKGAGPDAEMRWVSVTDGGTCQSCEKRHNRIEKLSTWQLMGRPGSRQLRCGSRCRCRLINARFERHGV